MNNFILKCIVITICMMIFISFIPVQKYDFPNPKIRCNKFTGEVEYYSDYFGRWETK